MKTLSSDESAVAEVVGEILLSAIAVLAFAAIVTFIFANLGADESARVDVDAWTDIDTDTVSFRHTGGETIDVSDIAFLVNINGTIERIDSSQISSFYGRDIWEFGDTIELNVSDMFGYNITENSSIESKLIHTSANLVVFDSFLSGSSSLSSGSGGVTPDPTCGFARWAFDTGSGSIAYDSVGSYDATIYGATWISAIDGNGLSFDGTNDYVQKTMDLPQNEITVMFWMKSSDSSKSGTPFSYAASHNNEFLIYNYRSFAIYRGNSNVATGVSANDGDWHHIAVTWKGSDGSTKLYKDGSLAYSGTLASGTSIGTGGSVVMGQEQDSVGGGFALNQAFLGDLDDVRICDSILSESEITQIYNAVTLPQGSESYRVSASSDDAEERVSNGAMSLTSSDLELIRDGSQDQVTGMRFQNVDIPQGSTISSAKIVFIIDENNAQPTTLNIYGHDIDDSPEFSSSDYNISSRAGTSAVVQWNSLPSPDVGETLESPDISSVVQEIVSRSGWSSGNSMTVIINGTGKRVVESYDGVSSSAPLLVVEYS
ncbi:LamG-like jellyroll fold domain-containing protein [Methanohalophilus levihalophilus]|uniref:LamG-like jellyroll fold domain-containing protein n=1 Tax=Methanohalophilus levihalophilus TaxID=1431282 RepID=UPI001AE1195A|nr:LamG-like jellyroll fold domain-containing protein [Methanohalophilus levihalophilus]